MTSMSSQINVVNIHEEVASAKGCESTNCGTDETPDMNPEIWEKIKDHPCYSVEAHHHFARMHVAVAPACNIQCNYCNRKYDCSNESRPGVVSERLTPTLAVKKVLLVASEIPQMSVLGIAGPGDAFANPQKTFDTFEMLNEKAPDIKLCISTNGLMLPEYVEQLKKYNVDHVTITINMIDPKVGIKIYPWIYYNNKRIRGEEASEILSQRQMQGLEMLTEAGILTKINSVLIPGVNDKHLVEVNKAVKSRGAFLHNIMPLISEPEHGTYYGLNGQREPNSKELKVVQDECSGNMKIMRHCRQCRADAVGLLGEDRSSEFTIEKIKTVETVEYDIDKREKYREKIQAQSDKQKLKKDEHLDLFRGAMQNVDISIYVAVATKGKNLVNQHFGHAKEFQIYEIDKNGSTFIGHRRVDLYCEGGYGEDEVLETIINAINDCEAVMASKIGRCPKEALLKSNIMSIQEYAFQPIEQSLLTYFEKFIEDIDVSDFVSKSQDSAEIRQGAYTK